METFNISLLQVSHAKPNASSRICFNVYIHKHWSKWIMIITEVPASSALSVHWNVLQISFIIYGRLCALLPSPSTVHHGVILSTCASYLGGLECDSWLECWLSWLEIFLWFSWNPSCKWWVITKYKLIMVERNSWKGPWSVLSKSLQLRHFFFETNAEFRTSADSGHVQLMYQVWMTEVNHQHLL